MNEFELLKVLPIKVKDEDKYILVMGACQVIPQVFDTREEAETRLEMAKNTDLEMVFGMINAVWFTINEHQKRVTEELKKEEDKQNG